MNEPVRCSAASLSTVRARESTIYSAHPFAHFQNPGYFIIDSAVHMIVRRSAARRRRITT